MAWPLCTSLGRMHGQSEQTTRVSASVDEGLESESARSRGLANRGHRPPTPCLRVPMSSLVPLLPLRGLPRPGALRVFSLYVMGVPSLEGEGGVHLAVEAGVPEAFSDGFLVVRLVRRQHVGRRKR